MHQILMKIALSLLSLAIECHLANEQKVNINTNVPLLSTDVLTCKLQTDNSQIDRSTHVHSVQVYKELKREHSKVQVRKKHYLQHALK